MKHIFGSVIAVFSFVAGPVAAAPATLNLPAAFDTILPRVQASQPVDVVVLGDSLTFRAGNYFDPFTKQLKIGYGDAGGGYRPFSLYTGASLSPGWTSGPINADPAPHIGLDGLLTNAVGGGGGAIPFLSNRLELHYLTQPGGGSFTPYIQTGSGLQRMPPVSTQGAVGGIGVWSHTLGPGESGARYQVENGQAVTFLGGNNVIPGNAGFRTHRVANGGFGVENFLWRQQSFDAQLGNLSPEMVMVWLGQNDQEYNRSTYATAMNQLVDRVQFAAPGAEIVLIGTYNQGSPLLAEIVEGTADVAAARGVGFINMYELGGTPQFLQSQGYLDDGVHFSPAGGEYFASILLDLFNTQLTGATSIPEPSVIAGLTAICLILRRHGR